MKKDHTMRRLLLALCVWLFALPALAAQTPEEFYRGKTITYIVCTAPGGGYDTYGRLLVRAMSRLMPDTKIIVRNLPGAGHVVGANTIYAAKPDGLTFGTFNTGLIYLQLLQDKAIRFDLAKMSWIGKAGTDTRVLVLSKSSGATSIEDLLDPSKPRQKLFAAGVGSAAYIDALLAIQALHLNADLIPGYNGNEGTMSMLRGETQGTVGSLSSNEQFVHDGNGFFALQAGDEPGVSIPQADKYVKDEQGRQLMRMIAAESVIARPTAGPPGIPADRLAYLRDIYLKALSDPQTLEEAKKQDLPIVPGGGEATRKQITEALDQSPDNIALLAKAVKQD